MSSFSKQPSRKDVLCSLIALPAFAGIMASSTGVAQAKASKAQFKYQTKPNGGHQCSGCALFIPGSSKTAMGSCQVVDGSISPSGWCTAFAKKS